MVLTGGAPVIGGNRGHRISKTAASKAQMLAVANSSILHRNARVGTRGRGPWSCSFVINELWAASAGCLQY
jgi:hypothetical protein